MSEMIIVVIIALLLGMLFLKYIWWSAGRDMQKYSRLAENADFRREELERITALLGENPDNETELLYERARVYVLSNDYGKALGDFARYTELLPDDSEGWAELADTYLKLRDTGNAYDAIQRAIKLEPEYAEYYEISLRISLVAENIANAEGAFSTWSKLDAKRVEVNKRPHRWSPMYQVGPKKATPDLALKSYEVAVLDMAGEREGAKNVVANMDDAEIELFKILLEDDEILLKLKEVYGA